MEGARSAQCRATAHEGDGACGECAQIALGVGVETGEPRAAIGGEGGPDKHPVADAIGQERRAARGELDRIAGAEIGNSREIKRGTDGGQGKTGEADGLGAGIGDAEGGGPRGCIQSPKLQCVVASGLPEDVQVAAVEKEGR